jgi:hypothetical protein
MRRIYLDQNKWIDLAACDHGETKGQVYRDVLTLAQAAVDSGAASFPLSMAHYMETIAIADHGRRRRLAATMGKLSRFQAIAPRNVIQPMEIDLALKARFQRPIQPRTCQVFGVGIGHVLGDSSLSFQPPPGWSAYSPEGVALRDEFETAMLERPPYLHSKDVNPRAHRETALEFAARQEEYARFLATLDDKSKKNRLLAVQSMKGVVEPLSEALDRAGITPLETARGGIEGLMSFLEDIPTAHVDYEIWRLWHENPQRPWKRGDLADLTALSVATPYCHVLVTENDAADMARRAKLDQMYETVILTDLRELAPLLAAG